MTPAPQKKPVIAPQQTPDVMGAMKAEKVGTDSTKTPEEIIRTDSARQGLDPVRVLKGLASDKKNNPQVKTVQIGNTVFLVKQVEPGTVESHIFTSESPQVIAKRYAALVNILKSQGMKRGYTYSDQPGFKKVAEMTGLPVKVTQTTQPMGGTIKPVYKFELEF